MVSSRAPEPVFVNLPAQGVAVHPEKLGGLADVALDLLQGMTDEALLELTVGVVVADPFGQHLEHQLIQLVPHAHQCISVPVRRLYASRYLSRVLATTSSGSVGTGGCLFHRICSR